ncbi:YadA family autotransporter adhesin [Sphingomonas abietis]|uniref:YadA-like family protein n=1 Tax=Sphingomonas abietis TaxID=3012344 RepID=A0ABY7NSL2_9SPHN|nr:YadA-like family protein [Sphingomonas abietis]WBO24363.1 YadA-like family protein [Sphingomonas abietis]
MVLVTQGHSTDFIAESCAGSAANRAHATKRSISAIAILMATACLASQAHAQAATTPNLVSACSGVSLPRSAVTGIITPVINGIVDPIQTAVNPLLGVLGLNINTTTLLDGAAAGDPITLQVLNANGTVVGPDDRCDLQADSLGLNTEGGIAIGGNRITGLGTNGQQASAGEANSIAFGNAAATAATSANSIAFGSGASVGENAADATALGTGAQVTAANSVALGSNSVANRGASPTYTATGLATPQTSFGEVSVGAAGAERQITNVAAGSAPTDAVNVAQLDGVAAQVGDVADTAVFYDSAAKNNVTLAGAGGTTITNVAPGALAATSTDAVNGSQLFATNGNVTNNMNAITNLTSNIQNGSVGTVRYSNSATPTVPNGGTPTNDLTLVGATAAPVGLHDVRDGTVAAGSTDAVNGGQLYTLSSQVGTLGGLAVQYDDATRTRVTLGGAGAAPVALGNVAAGTLAAGSTDAVNGGQLVALGNGVAGAIGGGTAYDPTTNSLTTSLTYGGATYGSVQAAFNAVDGAVNGGAGIRYFHVQSTLGDSVVSADNSMAIGPEANASAANSVALGTGSTAARGANVGYTAVGLAAPQTSAGELSVGAAGEERQITNVAAGSAPTDAVNVAQLTGVADQVAALGSTAVQYDGTDKSTVTLGGAGGTTVTNVKAGTVSATSTDAVNGSQLYATNVNVANNTTAITNLSNSVANGSAGPVQYSNPDDPTTPNGGTRTNDLTLVGAAAGSVGLHNVGNGSISAGSTDAVNGGQVYALALTAVNAVSYDTDANGNRTNTVTLAGGNLAAPVTIANVADGTVAAGSTEAVNGGQLYTTNQAVTTAQTTANTALALGQNSVQYDNASHTDVTLGSTGGDDTPSAPVAVHNVAAGTSPTDAVNLAQLNSGINSAVTQANSYTDQRFAAINYDLRKVRRDSYAGTAGALAAAGLPQAYEAGKGMVAMAGGTYQGQSAFALGLSKAMNDSHTVVKLSATYDTQGRAGGAAGVGYQF